MPEQHLLKVIFVQVFLGGLLLGAYLNRLIDIVDRISSANSAEENWKAANEIVRDMGGNALNAADCLEGHAEALWIRSTMSDRWMDHYMSEAFYEIDPYLEHVAESYDEIAEETGEKVVAEGADPRRKALDRGLKDGGYATMVGFPFSGQIAGTKRILTFCSGNSLEELGLTKDKKRIKLLRVSMALISSNLSAPDRVQSGDAYFPSLLSLSDREKQVLRQLAHGKYNDSIAETLGIAEVTVRAHLNSARKKLRASTREQALAIALAGGFLDI